MNSKYRFSGRIALYSLIGLILLGSAGIVLADDTVMDVPGSIHATAKGAIGRDFDSESNVCLDIANISSASYPIAIRGDAHNAIPSYGVAGFADDTTGSGSIGVVGVGYYGFAGTGNNCVIGAYGRGKSFGVLGEGITGLGWAGAFVNRGVKIGSNASPHHFDPLDGNLFVKNNVEIDGTTYGNVIESTSLAVATDATIGGNLHVTGTITKGSISFKIDHPLDPENKYLMHSCVESPDMMNIYNGNVILGDDGNAVISLPDWFEAVNGDYRYQLTPIGGAAPNLHVETEVKENQFSIGGGTGGLKVSWQVTGVRKDAYAEAHRIPVEVDKVAAEKGKYLYPVEQGRAATQGIMPVKQALPPIDEGEIVQNPGAIVDQALQRLRPH